jgi:predicted glycosyltransferase
MSAAGVMIYAQHLLGIGHLKRAERLARGLAARGFEVHLVSGGMPVEGLSANGVRIHQLPPLRSADLTFSTLLDETGRDADDSYKRRRRDRLLAIYRAVRPAAVILETYPFGRRMMRFELEPLLDAVGGADRPLLLSSIRDVLQQRSQDRIDESVRLIEARFDAVLVHGDPALIPLDASFPAERIAAKLHYTGYMAEPARPAAAATPTGEVVVSAGGGAVGARLLETALAARPLTRLKAAPWRLIGGDNMDGGTFDALCRRAGEEIVVERSRRDFAVVLASARLSVSQAGYNTVLDLLRAGTPSVLVPFAGLGETEQPTRARALAARGRAEIVDEAALGPESLAAAIDARAGKGAPPSLAVDLNGMANSARLVAGMLGARG